MKPVYLPHPKAGRPRSRFTTTDKVLAILFAFIVGGAFALLCIHAQGL